MINSEAPEFPEGESLPENATTDSVVEETRADSAMEVSNVLSLTKDQIRLKEMRERGELSPHDFDLNQLFQFVEAGIPVTRVDIGNQAIVLTRDDLDQLGYLDVVYKTGDEARIDTEAMNDSVLIIFPHDLAE